MSDINVIVRSIHFDADVKLEEFINKRIQKLASLSDHIIDAEVFLKLENAVENKTVEIKLRIPGNDLFAKKNGKSFEDATDQVCEALKRQLKKRKEKVWGIT